MDISAHQCPLPCGGLHTKHRAGSTTAHCRQPQEANCVGTHTWTA